MNQMNMTPTPAIEISAPNISTRETFSLKMIIDGGMMSTGTVAIMVEATPVDVC